MKNRELTNEYKRQCLSEVALPVCIDRCEDNKLIDIEGNSYIDFTSGYGVVNTGWNRKELIEAASKQIAKLSYSPPWFPSVEAVELAKTLHRFTCDRFVKCIRTTGGAEAVEAIFRASYSLNSKPAVLSFYRSYHGGTGFAIKLSDHLNFRFPPLPTQNAFYKIEPPYCFRCPIKKKPESCDVDCIYMLESALKAHPDIGIFYLEPVIGSGGVIVIPELYLIRAQQLCKEFGVTFAFDEVITGFGRLGAPTAMDLYNVSPDAVAFAKGMGSGLVPIGAAMVTESLAASYSKYEDVSPTFAWTPLACGVAKANIDLLRAENLDHQAREKGEYLLGQLQHLFYKYVPEKVGEIRGVGMLIGIELVNNQQEKIHDIRFTQRLSLGLVRNGLMVCETWNFEVIFVCPPLNISREQIDLALSIIENELKKVQFRTT